MLARVLDKLDAIFQSTHPVRGATLTDTIAQTRIVNFNPRTP